jgi:hypothetical protein
MYVKTIYFDIEILFPHTQVPIVMLSLVDSDRVFFKCAVGINWAGTSVPKTTYFAHDVVNISDAANVLVVLDAMIHPRYRTFSNFVHKEPHVRFYAGAPITVNGSVIGSLCAIDSNARNLFSVEDRMNLMDCAFSISVVAERRRFSNMLLSQSVGNGLLSSALKDTLGHPLKNLRDCLQGLGDLETRYHLPAATGASSIQDIQLRIRQMDSLVGTEGSGDTLSSYGFIDPSAQEGNMHASHLLTFLKETVPMLCGDKRAVWEIDSRLVSDRSTIASVDVLSGIALAVYSYIVMHSQDLHVGVQFVKFNISNSQGSGVAEGTMPFVYEQSQVAETGHMVMTATAQGFCADDYLETQMHTEFRPVGNSKMSTFFVEERSVCELIEGTGGICRTHYSPDHGSDRGTLTFELAIPCRVQVIRKAAPTITRIASGEPGECDVASAESTCEPASHIAPAISEQVLRVLVVDDCLSIQKILGKWLTRQKCEVQLAINGLVGVEALQAENAHFDIVFMDFLMPVMVRKQLNQTK